MPPPSSYWDNGYSLGWADEDGGRTDTGMLSSWMNERTANPQGTVHTPLDHNHDIVFFLEVVLIAFDDLAART